MRSLNHSKFEIYYHLVLVTKYRHQCINQEVLQRLEGIFRELLGKWKCSMVEFGGEADHVHILIDAQPSMDLSVFVNNLKTVSSRYIRKEFAGHLRSFYWKPYFWSRGYGIKSACRGATLDKLIEYVLNQEKPEN